MTTALIPDEGFSVYEQHQNILLDVLREHGGSLTQDEFDAEFGWREEDVGIVDGRRMVRPVRGRIFPIFQYRPEAVILGGLSQGSWGQWLCLLQHMAQHGIVEIEGESPNIVYRLGEEST